MPSPRISVCRLASPNMPRLIASWFGSGLILRTLRGSDLGSGTVGAGLALPLALILGRWEYQLPAALLVIALSVWSSSYFASQGDPGWVVVDEAAGALVATIGLTGWPALAAWTVFRLADIFKRVPGVGAAERLPGGWGITADDVVAGLYGLAAGWLIQVWIG